MEVGATYHDGETARPQRVTLRPDRVGERLVIVGPDGAALDSWDFADIYELRDHGLDRALVVHRPDHAARLVLTGAAVISDFRAMVPGIGRFHYDRRVLRRVAWWAGGAVGAMALLLFVVIPGLADTLARWIPPESEVAFGETMTRQFGRLFGEGEAAFCESADAQAALDGVAARLAPDADLPYPIRVRVLDNAMVNAFAVPGGHVVIMRGLIDEAESGEEVAAVLAHEIGHVVARDPTRIALRAAGSAGLLGLFFGDFAGGTAVTVMTDQLLQASYTRDAEAAADGFALRALADTGLPTTALAGFFARLRAEFGDESDLAAAFLSHPRLADRIAAAEAAETGEPGDPAFTGAQWAALREVCG